MIQLSRHALMVCYEDGRMEPLGIQDLLSSMPNQCKLAAASMDPWVIETVFESVIRHIQEDQQRDKLPLSELVEMVSGLLSGYSEEVLQNKEIPQIQLDLFETARSCGTGFELEFYTALRRFFTDHADLKPQPLQITGLRRCAKFLTGRRRWSKRCSDMRDEIVSFIRTEAARKGTPNMILTMVS